MIKTAGATEEDLRMSMRIEAMQAKNTDLRQIGRETAALEDTGLRWLLGWLVDLLHKVREGEVGQETDLVVGLAVARWNEDRMAEEGGKLELDTTMSKGGNWSTNLCCWRVGARCRAGERLASRTWAWSPGT